MLSATGMAHPQSYDPYYLHHQPPLPPQQDYDKDRGAINTLFVSGLPDDIKAREIHNLFRRRPGFDSCQLKYTGRGSQVVAFATFFNHQSAIAALQALNGVKFDPQIGSVLHVELARSNSRRKRKPGSGAYVVIDKRSKAHTNTRETSSDDGDSESDEPSESGNLESGKNGDLAASKRLRACISTLIALGETTAAPDSTGASGQEQQEKNVGGPCTTLFIANLGPACTEDELKQALSQYPGFRTLKVRAKGGMPVAFADFEEIEQTNKAMQELQGSYLASSDRGGMHIEYARSKMWKR